MKKRKLHVLGWILSTIIVAVLVNCSDRHASRETFQREKYLVGAHYYMWYPDNFRHGYTRAKLKPPQEPVLGTYDSRDTAVIEQHIAWCSRYGIDFLTLDWWPSRSEQNNAGTDAFLKARNIDDIHFSIFFETWDLNFDPSTGATIFTDDTVDRFVEQMEMLADRFFHHPAYLKIDGRPVVFLYLTRTFSGKYREAMAAARSALAQKGVNPFFIGDEMFWKVMAETDTPEGKPWADKAPQRERIGLFDAIFSYNLYDWSQPDHAGYGARSSFIDDCRRLYRKYSKAALPEIGFVPDILPGYNDRGVRPGEDHHVIPRQWDNNLPEGSFLSESFEKLVFPFVDPDLNMMLITSFNEWNEDTAIEPLKEAPPTVVDSSDSGQLYTEGFNHFGFGKTHLKVIQDKVIAVAGRIVDSENKPLAGYIVQARNESGIVAQDTSDQQGYYVLSRKKMVPGKFEVELADLSVRQNVTVSKQQTATEVDFIVTSEELH